MGDNGQHKEAQECIEEMTETIARVAVECRNHMLCEGLDSDEVDGRVLAVLGNALTAYATAFVDPAAGREIPQALRAVAQRGMRRARRESQAAKRRLWWARPWGTIRSWFTGRTTHA